MAIGRGSRAERLASSGDIDLRQTVEDMPPRRKISGVYDDLSLRGEGENVESAHGEILSVMSVTLGSSTDTHPEGGGGLAQRGGRHGLPPCLPRGAPAPCRQVDQDGSPVLMGLAFMINAPVHSGTRARWGRPGNRLPRCAQVHDGFARRSAAHPVGRRPVFTAMPVPAKFPWITPRRRPQSSTAQGVRLYHASLQASISPGRSTSPANLFDATGIEHPSPGTAEGLHGGPSTR
jgi:hypothetical protein